MAEYTFRIDTAIRKLVRLWLVSFAIALVITIAIFGTGLYLSSHQAPAKHATHAPACTWVRATHVTSLTTSEVVTVCAAYVPVSPPAIIARYDLTCHYVTLDIPGSPAVQLQCRYAATDAIPLTYHDGVTRNTYTECLYVADEYGAQLFCYLTTDDAKYNASQEE